MFKAEVYRILSRKVGMAAMVTGLLFILYYTMGNTVWAEGVIDDDKIFYGEEAIARDREIAAEFAGPLTEETVRAIWEKYGSPVNYPNRNTTREGMEKAAAKGGYDNYCNRLVARLFGEWITDENGESVYVLAQGWTESRYLQGDYVFGYTGSNSWYWDRFMMAYQLAYVAIIVLLSPMFSEDYALRTADIILPTAKGRFKLWKMRMAVGCCVASAYYWLACGSVFLFYVACYGTDGLAVSCALAGLPMYFPIDYVPMWRGFLLLYLCGWFAALVLTVLVCAVSAFSRQSFSSLVRSLLLYIGPFAFMRLILDSLPMSVLNSLLHYICYSMPFSYSGVFAEAPDSARRLMAVIALSVMLLGAAAGACRYCRHQVT